jgi:hypothetical protein
MVLCSSCDVVPLKLKKKNGRASNSRGTDFLSSVLTPHRIRWTIPLNKSNLENKTMM